MSTIEIDNSIEARGHKLNTMSVRERVSGILNNNPGALLAIVGPCALTSDVDIVESENRRGDDFTQDTGITVLHRMPPWKPRTNPEDWHGEETTNPGGAIKTIETTAKRTSNVCIEIGLDDHVERYSKYLSFAWIGGRNSTNIKFQNSVSQKAPGLPLGIKNGLDGEIGEPLLLIDTLNKERGGDAAPVVLIYRGGSNAKNPEDWEKQYQRAIELTDGKMIVDVAHGGEMAHDPNQQFKKSVEGQIACLEHVIQLAKAGLVPAGVMIEASDAVSPTDPNMPFTTALDKIRQLKQVITS